MYDTDVHKIKEQVAEILKDAAFCHDPVDMCAKIAEALALVIDQIPTRYDHGQD